jgi:hypothetical protein
MENSRAPLMEFHVSRQARDRYKFSESLFALSGNVLLANLHAARVFAQKMNEQRDLTRFPERTVRAGHLNAMGLIDEILHFIFGLYREQKSAQIISQAMAWLKARHGTDALDKALRAFMVEFPPVAVYNGQLGPNEYLEGAT